MSSRFAKLHRLADVFKTCGRRVIVAAHWRARRVPSLVRRFRLALAEKALPSEYLVQSLPDYVTSLHRLRGVVDDVARYNKGTDPEQLVRDGNRVLMLRLLLEHVQRCEMGDYAEVGTFRGNSASLIFKYMVEDCELVCFDTFEGCDARDVDVEQRKIRLRVMARTFSETSIADVEHAILGNEAREGLKLVKGFFPASFKGFEDRAWRFVHLDCDLYEPTRMGLHIFWERLVPGGVLLVHDYNHGYRGVHAAVGEFCAQHGQYAIPLFDKACSCLLIKAPGRPLSAES